AGGPVGGHARAPNREGRWRMAEPARPVSGGRDQAGKFAVGNRLGRGNPIARRMFALRRVLLQSVTREDIEAAGQKLAELAVGGDVQALRLLFEYPVGRPVQRVEWAGPDGEPLAFDFGQLALELVGVLNNFPEARGLVAAKLRALARGEPRPPDDGGSSS